MTLELDRPARVAPAGTVPPSCLHAAFRSAEQHELRTGAAVNRLHVGEPAFGPPAVAVDALHEAVRAGRTAYTSAEGMLALREALAAGLAENNGHATTPDRVFVTPGSCQGLAAVLQSIVTRGAELLLPELHWPIHLQQVLLAGFRPVLYRLRPDRTPDVDSIAELAGPRTSAILVNSPSNPTGAVAAPGDLRAILGLADRHGWHVISDEAYEHFVYDGEHLSMAALESDRPAARRRVFSTFSFSKSFAMTGLRLGYVVAPNDTTAHALRTVQEASIIAPATPVQYAGLAALSAPEEPARNSAFVRAARDRALPELCAAGLLPELPHGGWYAILDVAASGRDAEDFAEHLLATEEVSVAPASGFALRPRVAPDGTVLDVAPVPAARSLVRIAMCGDQDLLADGVARILRCVRESGAAR